MSIKITEEGKTLLEDAILQDKKVVFSQIELIADVEKSPTEMVKRVDVSKVSASDYNTITVQAQIDNDGFLDTYYFNRANVYADEVLFAYDDGINICIPAETTKVINDLEMMMKIDSAVADLKIIYEGYVLRKDFNDMESKIQKINTTIKDMEANAVTQNDCTDQVSWNSQIVKKEFLTIGNMAFFRATGGFSTSRGSIVLATIPQGYFPETTRNQSSYELMGVFTSAYDKERRNCYVTLNCLSGNVDLQINNNEAYSDTRSDDNVQMIFYGFWKMNTESQGGTGGSISYREDIENLRQSIQDSKKEIVRSSREIDSLKEDKITKPAEAPTIGKIIRVKSVNEDGTFVCEWADSASDLDVRIDGKSIVQDGVAEIPVAGFTSPTQIRKTGLVCVPSGYGIDFQFNTHNLIISNPSTNLIDRRNNMWQADYYATTVRKIDYAVKAAMCDGKGTAWTVEEQAAARERMGIDEWELACDVTLEKDSNNVIIQLNEEYREVYGILKFPVVPSGEHRMMFYDTNNGSWNNTQGAFCQDVRCNERTFIHAGIYDGIAIFDYHGQTQTLAPYPYPVSRSMRECKDTRINAFATFAFTSPSGTNFKIWGRKI